jgi:hypothetical protein
VTEDVVRGVWRHFGSTPVPRLRRLMLATTLKDGIAALDGVALREGVSK